MTIFDQFYFSIFSFFKKRFKQKANTFAVLYISILEISLMFLLGCFLAVFFSKMHVNTMSKTTAWVLFVVLSFCLYFKNWMQYTGKRRLVINAQMAKNKKRHYSITLLCCLPFIITALGLILFQAV